MTIIVYSCNPDITISSSTNIKQSPNPSTTPNSTTPTRSPSAQTLPPLHHNSSSENLRQFRNNLTFNTNSIPQHRKSLIVQNTNTLIANVKNLTAKSDENIYKSIMTKSPIGSQLDITGTKFGSEVKGEQTGGVGNFIKNHLRNTSPSKNSNNDNIKRSPKKDPNKSPKSNKKVTNEKTKNLETHDPVVPKKEERHGSFSSPFKMPKFTSSATSSGNEKTETFINTATSAIRRLHFKSGRNATKSRTTTNGTNLPKVIVMGSSSTSETTINTSTDSANTVITTMTNTDDYLTEDSLDKQDCCVKQLIDLDSSKRENSSKDILKQSTNDSLDDTFLESDEHATTYVFDNNTEPTPKTALFYEQKFTFDPPPQIEPKSPKYEMKESKNETKFSFDNVVSPTKFENNQKKFNKMVSGSCSGAKHLKRRQSENLSSRSSGGRTSPSVSNLDHESSPKSAHGITGSPSTSSSHHHRTHSRRRRQSSPKNELRQKENDNETKVHQSKKPSHYERKKSIPKVNTSNLPDLRVDFFSNSIDMSQPHDIITLDSVKNANGIITAAPTSSSVCLNQCLRDVGARLECALTTPCSSIIGHNNINVTTNPLDSSSVHSAARLNSIPQATIVVQQPSLSLDSAANVSTVLLKNGTEFVSNVSKVFPGVVSAGCGKSATNKSTKRKDQQQREENMKHLLEVANTLTLEELHDFEMRYGSPHHSRSQSVKTPGRSSGGRPNYLCLPQQRSRVASMPNTGVEEEYYRLRHFSITGKGVVNRGDSLKSRRSRSNNSVASSNSSTEHLQTQPGPASYPGSARTSVSSRESSNTSQPGGLLVSSAINSHVVQAYRVTMLGAAGVGKSSLVSQFMTSEYLHAYDTSIDDDSGEKSVSVLLAGEESELTFIDLAYAELSPQNMIGTYATEDEPHAYCVVYSCADRGSLDVAERALAELWTTGLVASKAIILVANKADLVRSRVVTTEEGKAIATQFDCKFIETSVGINHNVDELLVGILTQIRLKLENPEKTRDLFRKRSCSKKGRNKSPNRSVGSTITSALTSCGGANINGPALDADQESQRSLHCWGGSNANLGSDSSAQNSPKKYRGTRLSASLKVKGLLGKVWARDSKSKSCENLHVL